MVYQDNWKLSATSITHQPLLREETALDTLAQMLLATIQSLEHHLLLHKDDSTTKITTFHFMTSLDLLHWPLYELQ